jgi:acyl-CoA thioester hydrolase
MMRWNSARFQSILRRRALPLSSGGGHSPGESMSALPSREVTPNPQVRPISHTIQLRVRYSETDQMGTVYNSRPLEWFECGRTELLRSLGMPYAELERQGVYLPLIESHVEYLGRAQYDDLLELTTAVTLQGRVRLRCAATVVHAIRRQPVVRGYTVHAFTNPAGKPIRPPAALLALLNDVHL